ncbi:MAG TPA: efflux transporter outer membrane subunit [Deferrisomatales bacterium]|nr:efflux transporter outer membrane subunit [Deferrisomatales bacterium]
MRARRWVPLLVVGVLAACAGPREFTAPEPPAPAPAGFVNDGSGAAEAVLAEGWWRRFGDPALDALVEEAVRGNLDLRQAATRVAEARALLVQAGAADRPAVTAGASAQRARNPNPLGDPISSRYSLSLGFSYEVDLWGRVANVTEAAVQDLYAAEQDQIRAYHSLVADVVRNYAEMRIAEDQASLSQETVENDRQRLGVIENRYAKGLSPALDLYQARQTLAQAESRGFTFRQRAQQARHRLNILRGRYPAATGEERSAPAGLGVPEPVPAGLPADLLARRPDLRAAERRVAAANARLGVAEANLYPRFALTGSGGRISDTVRDLSLGGNTVWSLLGNLTYPLYNAGANRAAVSQAEARRQGAVLAFGSAYLEALGQVEDVLVSEREQRNRLEALERSVELAQRTLEVSQWRYLRGLDNLTPTLNARNALFLAQVEQLETRRTLLLNRVSLFLALGGDWGHEAALVEMTDAVIERDR